MERLEKAHHWEIDKREKKRAKLQHKIDHEGTSLNQAQLRTYKLRLEAKQNVAVMVVVDVPSDEVPKPKTTGAATATWEQTQAALGALLNDIVAIEDKVKIESRQKSKEEVDDAADDSSDEAGEDKAGEGPGSGDDSGSEDDSDAGEEDDDEAEVKVTVGGLKAIIIGVTPSTQQNKAAHDTGGFERSCRRVQTFWSFWNDELRTVSSRPLHIECPCAVAFVGRHFAAHWDDNREGEGVPMNALKIDLYGNAKHLSVPVVIADKNASDTKSLLQKLRLDKQVRQGFYNLKSGKELAAIVRHKGGAAPSYGAPRDHLAQAQQYPGYCALGKCQAQFQPRPVPRRRSLCPGDVGFLGETAIYCRLHECTGCSGPKTSKQALCNSCQVAPPQLEASLEEYFDANGGMSKIESYDAFRATLLSADNEKDPGQKLLLKKLDDQLRNRAWAPRVKASLAGTPRYYMRSGTVVVAPRLQDDIDM